MKNEIITQNEKNLDNEKTYCSIVCKNNEDKKNLFNSLEKADALLIDVVGTEINLANVYIHRYDKLNDKTGELESKVRIILFDENGTSYATGSFGIFNIIGRIFEVFGTPDKWSEPLKVKVIKKDIENNRKMLSLELI